MPVLTSRARSSFEASSQYVTLPAVAELLITPSSTARLPTGTRIFAAAISKRLARVSAAA
jgi:hypothetical protein